MIPYARQHISDDDIDAVVKILRSDFLTQGPVVPKFEAAVSNYCGSKYGVAVNSATSALHIASLALEIGVGDIVWTTPITFVASANCAIHCGAKIDFVDVDPLTYNMSVEALNQKLIHASKYGGLPKLVIAVHLSGQPCDMEGIYILGKKYGFKIIEDASHAIGAKYKGDPVGNCKYSDITVFSFHPVKIITTGEGGMAVTNDASLSNKMMRLRSHGITRDPLEMTHSPDGPWYYQQIELGFNYRMTEMYGALGLSQLSRVDEFITKRRLLASRYDELLAGLPITLPYQHKDSYSSTHLYIIRLKEQRPGFSRRELFERLRSNGIGVNLHYIPIYHHPFYESMGFKAENFPEAERYYAEAITLPIYYNLEYHEQDNIVNSLITPLGHQTIF
jgi:UDP-4-amino-4,6-dideoxy-N-acetyl-beta-L-altrosamine transaminase